MRERHRMVQVHGLALGLGTIRVNQSNLSREPAQQKGISKSGADISGSNNSDTRGMREEGRRLRGHTTILNAVRRFSRNTGWEGCTNCIAGALQTSCVARAPCPQPLGATLRHPSMAVAIV